METASAGTVGRTYTKGRRQPYLIRKWPGSNWALPLSPHTITQLLVFVGSVYLPISYRNLWVHFRLFNLVIAVGLPLLLTYLTRHHRKRRRRGRAASTMIGPVLPGVPFRAIVGNLAWTHDGTVWAVWRIDPLPYRYASDNDKLSFGRVVGNLLRALRGEPLLLSLCGLIDPADAAAGSPRAAAHRHPIHREITEGYQRLLAD